MSLKVYINNEVQAFRKRNTQDLLFGLQGAPNNELIGIHGAYAGVVSTAITSYQLVKINSVGTYDSSNNIYNYAEVERIDLPLGAISYNAAANQYIIDTSIAVGFTIDECVYFIEFTNGADVFKTEAFQVSVKFNYPKDIFDDAFVQTISASSFDLPLVNGYDYDFFIDWDDGNIDHITTYNQAEKAHIYSESGTYQIKIAGKCGGWSFNNGGDKLKVTSVDNWGKVEFDYLISGFHGCSNLTSIPLNPIGQDDYSTIISLQYLFRDCNITGVLSDVFLSYLPTCTQIYGVFRDNLNITGSIPENFYSNNTQLTIISESLYGTGINGSLPSNLLSSNTALVQAASVIQNTNISGAIPSGFFDLNINLKNITAFFNGTNIASIPIDLLRYNLALTTVTSLFANCLLLAGNIPENMFFYNKLITAYNNVFYLCENLVLPSVMFDLSALSIVTNFTTFLYQPTVLKSFTGTAQDIWNYALSASSSQAFYQNTSITNYASIPVGWK